MARKAIFGGVKGPLKSGWGPPSCRAPSLRKFCVCACSPLQSLPGYTIQFLFCPKIGGRDHKMLNFGQAYTWGRPTYPYLKPSLWACFSTDFDDRAELQSAFHFYLSRPTLQVKAKNDWCIFECIVSLTCSAIFAGVTLGNFLKSIWSFLKMHAIVFSSIYLCCTNTT